MSVGVGLVLPPSERDLELLAPLLESEPDYYEVAPETLWRVADGRLAPNGYHAKFAELHARSGRPFVAHGVAYSVGSASPGEDERRARWRDAIAASHATFDFCWYTDHLGATVLAGRNVALPMPLPMTAGVADCVRARLAALQTVVPDVGLENSVFYHLYGDPLDEPAFLARCVDAPRMHLLLDLLNVHVMAANFDFDAAEYVRRLPLERVVEIHVAGGGASEPGWLPGGATRRLDSHDHAVPEAVWALLESVLPRCTALRGVTLERMEGSLRDGDVPLVREELRRVRTLVR